MSVMSTLRVQVLAGCPKILIIVSLLLGWGARIEAKTLSTRDRLLRGRLWTSERARAKRLREAWA